MANICQRFITSNESREFVRGKAALRDSTPGVEDRTDIDWTEVIAGRGPYSAIRRIRTTFRVLTIYLLNLGSNFLVSLRTNRCGLVSSSLDKGYNNRCSKDK